jgi:DNA-binding NarL/FixJ family response regulator
MVGSQTMAVHTQSAGTEAEDPPRSNDDASRRDRKASDNKRILIVEDETILALDLQATLIASGFEVAGVARDSIQAYSLAGETRPALVIMDIRLADGSDGVDAAAAILENFGIKSVFLSAHLDADTRKRAEIARPQALLNKPVEPGTLIQVVTQALKAR